MGPRRRRSPGHLECDQFFSDPFGFLLSQNRAPYKFTFIKSYEKTQTGFHRRGFFIQLMAVKWITYFGAQRIPGAQTGRFQSVRMAGFKDRVPNRLDNSTGRGYFEPIFPAITRARNPNLLSIKRDSSDLVLFKVSDLRDTCSSR